MRWAVALALLLCACGRRTSPPLGAPELERVDPALLAEIRREVEGSDIQCWAKRGKPPVIAPNGGTEAAWAILKVLIEEFESPAGYSTGEPGRDWISEIPALRLGELADERIRAALCRGLAAPELSPVLRRKLAIALCREGDVQALDALVDRAIDPAEAALVRQAILERLHRIGVRAPERLRDALYLPFGGLDGLAAATLARMGDPEAPSLVLEVLESSKDDSELEHSAAASIAITGKGEPYPNPLVAHNGESFDVARRRGLQPHLDALRAWVARAPETEFERERRAYLASPRRARELALTSFEDILAAGEDFDLASAILLVLGDQDRERDLERLDRLACLARKRLAGRTLPEERIAALNAVVLNPRWSWREGAKETEKVSRLDYVLATNTGNCVGLSTLYLAVGDRCGVPLHGVSAPEHVFVRYDDGKCRHNIEATEQGAERPDESYRQGERGPVDISNRQVLASVLNNAAAGAAYLGRYAEALRLVTDALALDPTEGLFYLNRATFTFHGTLDADASVIADLEKAMALLPDPVHVRLDAAGIFRAIGLTERALRLYREVRAEDPSGGQAGQGEAICLVMLGRAEEARAEGLELPLEARIRLAPEDARELMARAKRGPTRELTAETLLELNPPRAADALEIVDEGLAEVNGWPDWIRNSDVITFSVLTKRHHRDLLALRGRALAALGRLDEARDEIAKALAFEGSNRLLLEARAYVESAAVR